MPAAFGKFEEDQGYGGHVQGANYMADLLRHGATGQKLTKYYNRRMCGVGTGPANSACADHCHKPTKRIHENGEQSAAPLAGMHRRLVRLQKKGVENLWVDDPPVSGPVLKEVFRTSWMTCSIGWTGFSGSFLQGILPRVHSRKLWLMHASRQHQIQIWVVAA